MKGKLMSEAINSSMLKKIKEFLTGRRTGDISPAEAERIQKAAYALSQAEIKKTFTPTYQSILLGLEAEEKQVFEGTVYYLVRIALNKKQYRDDIVAILQDKSHDKSLNPKFREFIKQQLEEI